MSGAIPTIIGSLLSYSPTYSANPTISIQTEVNRTILQTEIDTAIIQTEMDTSVLQTEMGTSILQTEMDTLDSSMVFDENCTEGGNYTLDLTSSGACPGSDNIIWRCLPTGNFLSPILLSTIGGLGEYNFTQYY